MSDIENWMIPGTRVELILENGEIYTGVLDELVPIGKKGELRARLIDMCPKYRRDFGRKVHCLAILESIRERKK